MNKAEGQIIIYYDAIQVIDDAVQSIRTIGPTYASFLFDVLGLSPPQYSMGGQCYRYAEIRAHEIGAHYNLPANTVFDICLSLVPAHQYSIAISNPTPFTGGTDSESMAVWKTPVFLDKFTCECGKEKHGFASHSTWCPKHD